LPSTGTPGIRETIQLSRLLEVVAQETIAIDPPDAEAHRVRLRQMANQHPGYALEPNLEQLIQLELRSYREASEKKVAQLRQDLASTGEAMQEYVTRFNTQDQSQEKSLTADLQRLSAIRQMTDLNRIHNHIDLVRESLAATVEQIKAQNLAIVTQLRDEIRTLHQRLDSPLRRESPGGTIANRAPFERRIRAKVNTQENFSLYLIRITNWKEIINLLEQDEAQTLVTNFGDRLAGILGPDTFTGRWYDGYFAAIVSLDKRTAMAGASDLAQRLGGVYPAGREPTALRARVAVVEHIPGQDPDQTLKRVEQLIRAFES
jgi:GGDEF domain-containing protein